MFVSQCLAPLFAQVWEAIGYQCCVIVALHCIACFALKRNGPKIQSLSKMKSKSKSKDAVPPVVQVAQASAI